MSSHRILNDFIRAFDSSGPGTAEQAEDIRDALSAVGSVTTGVTGAVAINNVIALTQAQYDAISTPDANTLYVIVEE